MSEENHSPGLIQHYWNNASTDNRDKVLRDASRSWLIRNGYASHSDFQETTSLIDSIKSLFGIEEDE
jgi:hypothetical protein